MTTKVEVEFDGRRVSLSNLDKVLWPRLGLTKGWMVDYYTRVAPALILHLRRHPLTLHRFPDGVEGTHRYETRAPAHPPWVDTVTFNMERTGKVFDVAIVDDLPSLVWAAQIAAVELHPFLGTAEALDRPRVVVFDLDPGHPARIVNCCLVALRVRDLLGDLGLEGWVKTSGGLGLHVYVPVNSPVGYTQTKDFARAIALLLERQYPDSVTSVMARARRAGKVFVDWGQNDFGKSTVAAYSLRRWPVPTVSTPVTWEEVAARGRGGLRRGGRHPAGLAHLAPAGLHRPPSPRRGMGEDRPAPGHAGALCRRPRRPMPHSRAGRVGPPQGDGDPGTSGAAPAPGKDQDRSPRPRGRGLRLPWLPPSHAGVAEVAGSLVFAGVAVVAGLGFHSGQDPHPDDTRPRELPLEEVVERLNPVLRGWGAYSSYGNSSRKFAAVDCYVNQRLAQLASTKHGLRGWNWRTRFTHGWANSLGIYRLSGTVRYWSAHA